MLSNKTKTFLASSSFQKILIATSLGFIFYQIYLYLEDGAILAYGYDSLRILGRAQTFRYLGDTNPLVTNRITLAFFISTIANFFSLPPSQTLTLPFIFINLLALLFYYRLILTFTQSKTIASLGLFLFVFVKPGWPLEVNDSSFISSVLLPLHLQLIYLLTQSANQTNRFKLNFLYLLLSFLCFLTHPALALFLHLITLVLLITYWLVNSPKTSKLKFIPIWHTLSFILYYLLIVLRTGSFDLTLFFTRDLNMNQLISFIKPPTASIMYILVNLTVSAFLHLKLPKLTQIPSFKLNSSLLNPIFLIISITASLIYFGQPHLNSLKNIIPAFNLTFPTLAIFILFIGLAPLFNVQKQKQPFLQALTHTILIYLLVFVLLLPTNFNSIYTNKRFINVILYMIFCVLPSLVLKKTKVTLTFTAVFILLLSNLSVYHSQYRLQQRSNTNIQQAADWLVKQPNHLDVMFFSPNLILSVSPNFEKPQGYYYASSRISSSVQISQNLCDSSPPTCFENIVDFAKAQNIKYIFMNNPSRLALTSSQAHGIIRFNSGNVYVLELFPTQNL